MKNYLLLAGTFLLLLTLGCAAVPPSSVDERAASAPTPAAPPQKTTKFTETGQGPGVQRRPEEKSAPPAAADVTPTQPPSPASEELAVLVVHSGALITQVNGDSTLRCMRPDCRIPLPPGMHRVTVKYVDTATRGGSTVTYASMYPRIVEINLEPGHRYSVTASGRHSQKWWISIEDQTANKTVYNDREKPQ